ncbi:MAG TPA: TIGR03088 family PEP-CTERM/XrtA system glycosyltransferase [Rhodocyclaceae bacterium]|nr:TIGR03088 family PEP-CTERM/XrtA system glycosyltransferase [Rhodocyclaceae bacterium]
MSRAPRHIVHLLYRFAAGGLENVIVQLVNGLPRENFRHTVVALTEIDPAFAARIERDDVEFVSLHKPPGQPFALYPKMYRLLRRLRPDVLHTCNIAALEFMPVAWLARVPLRIHAEHGWDVADPDGSNARYRQLRRGYARCVHRVVAVSAQIRDYWRDAVGFPASRLHLIANGVDCARFRPREAADPVPEGWPFRRGEHYVIGTVGRLEPIKNQRLLVEAFIRLAARPGNADLRLAIVGAGPLRDALVAQMAVAGLSDRLWLLGSRADIPEILRAFDCFVLPSLAEGTSCTLQEAMATALPIVATDVGGNADLLGHGDFGCLVPTDAVEALAAAILACRESHASKASAARAAAISHHSQAAMLDGYMRLMSGV